MILYLAESGGMWAAYFAKERGKTDGSIPCQAHSATSSASAFSGTNILQSFYYCDEFTEREIIPHCKRFLLDSGAFTFMQGKARKVDFEDYIDKHIAFINRNNIELFFEMDIDDAIGLDGVERIRRKLEKETGKQPIPVFHKSRGRQYFERMCEEYKYVAIGGITGAKEKREYLKYFPWFIETAHKHGARIHGLGFTDMNHLPQCHFDSVDSSSWTAGNRYGFAFKFNGQSIETIQRKDGQRIKSAKALAIHNFNERVKFQKYAETNL